MNAKSQLNAHLLNDCDQLSTLLVEMESGLGMRLLNLFWLVRRYGVFRASGIVLRRIFGKGTIPCLILEKQRGILNHLRSQIVNLDDRDCTGKLQELSTCVAADSVRGVFILGSRLMGWNERFKQRHHHIAEYLMANGFIVVCAMNPGFKDDLTSLVRQEGPRLWLANFEDPVAKWSILESVIKNAKCKVFFHLVGTEPGTGIEEIKKLQDCGVNIYYEYFDEISREIFPGLTDFQLARHEFLLRNPEVIICTTAQKLYEKATAYRRENIFISRNAVTLEDWDYIPERDGIPGEMAPVISARKPVIGFYGSFAPWLDYGILRALAEKRPDYNIVMIGYDYEGGKGAFAKSGIADLPNVHIIPAQKYRDLKKFSHWFDVGILPFRIYSLTETVSPVKIFEYMAQGKPVVATALPECKLYKSALLAEDADSFISQVDAALKFKDDAAYLAQLRLDAENNTWSKRGEHVLEVLSAVPQERYKDSRPVLSVGIPLYNMEKYIEGCLDSMLAPAIPAMGDVLEVIVVNDGSKDSSLEIARGYERKFPGVVKVIDKENGGHGSCINAAVRAARGRYFKLVDSDDWLDSVELIRHLRFLVKTEADFVVCDYRQVYEDGTENVVSYKDRIADGEYSAGQFWDTLSKQYDYLAYVHMHALTYKTAMLKNVVITEHSFYVDNEYITLPLVNCSTAARQSVCLYQYRLGRPGQSVDPAVVKKRIGQNLAVFKRIAAFHDNQLADKAGLRNYILGVLYNQSWFYLRNTDSAEGFTWVLDWWKSHKGTTRHPYMKLLIRDFSPRLETRDARIRRVERLAHSKFWHLLKKITGRA